MRTEQAGGWHMLAESLNTELKREYVDDIGKR
jgi:hypothetical protein